MTKYDSLEFKNRPSTDGLHYPSSIGGVIHAINDMPKLKCSIYRRVQVTTNDNGVLEFTYVLRRDTAAKRIRNRYWHRMFYCGSYYMCRLQHRVSLSTLVYDYTSQITGNRLSLLPIAPGMDIKKLIEAELSNNNLIINKDSICKA